MNAPRILTAIPQRRYQFGEYTGTLLGDIESGDEAKYQYILALVREGESRPVFYVTAEKNPRSRQPEGTHRLRVITHGMDEEIGCSDAWADIDAFCAEAFTVAAKVLGLSDEQAVILS
ncbi:MAG TPA: hypothetical protein VFU39_04195 [Sulfuricaulis sp.]|nr:hypothetical protein [Sulfuricaulis sp.]